MDNVLKEFKDYLEVYENMTFDEVQLCTNNLKHFVASCLKVININVLTLKTHNELAITMRAYNFVNKDERFSFQKVSKLYNQYLLKKTIMDWL